MYRKSLRTLQLERKRKRCAVMRAAKERKRIEQARGTRRLPPVVGGSESGDA